MKEGTLSWPERTSQSKKVCEKTISNKEQSFISFSRSHKALNDHFKNAELLHTSKQKTTQSAQSGTIMNSVKLPSVGAVLRLPHDVFPGFLRVWHSRRTDTQRRVNAEAGVQCHTHVGIVDGVAMEREEGLVQWIVAGNTALAEKQRAVPSPATEIEATEKTIDAVLLAVKAGNEIATCAAFATNAVVENVEAAIGCYGNSNGNTNGTLFLTHLQKTIKQDVKQARSVYKTDKLCTGQMIALQFTDFVEAI
jgi:hypothetical protein